MSDIYFIVIPVVIVVVILKLCLIFWRIWLYQKKRERVYLVQNSGAPARPVQPTARVVGLERTLGPEGFTQRTSYIVSHPRLPATQVTRTVVIRPNDNSRPNDPNLPPSYDHAVTGKDKSVKVQDDAPPTTCMPSAPPPPIHAPPPAGITGVPPPEYSAVASPSAPANQYEEDDHSQGDETRRLLV